MTKLYEDVFQIKRVWLCITMDHISAEFIIEFIKKNRTYEDLSDILK